MDTEWKSIGAVNMKTMYNDILAKINQRQRQVIVHSVIYYKFDTNIITDAKWSEWSQELIKLQLDYPEITSKSVFYKEMKDFDGSTGYHLAENEWGNFKAPHLLLYKGLL